MVKAIIFDFWGTLVENGVWSPIKQAKAILGIRLPFSEYVLRMEQAMMTKNFLELRQAFETLAQEFHLSPEESKIEELVGLWNKSWMLAKPYEETEEILSQLQQDYSLFLVSNTDNISLKKVLEKYPLFEQFFKKMYFSCEMGLVKTDPQFLTKVLHENKLKPKDVIVVGDSIQSDMIMASQLDVKGVLIDRRNTREFTPKIANLRELKGILI